MLQLHCAYSRYAVMHALTFSLNKPAAYEAFLQIVRNHSNFHLFSDHEDQISSMFFRPQIQELTAQCEV